MKKTYLFLVLMMLGAGLSAQEEARLMRFPASSWRAGSFLLCW